MVGEVILTTQPETLVPKERQEVESPVSLKEAAVAVSTEIITPDEGTEVKAKRTPL